MAGPYFDLFIIFAPSEKEQAAQIAARLEQSGRQVCLSGTRDDLARSLGCAILVGPDNLGQPDPPILRAALDRARLDCANGLFARERAFRVWPVLLPGLDDPFDLAGLSPALANQPWLDLRVVGYDPNYLVALCDPLRAESVLRPPSPTKEPFARWTSPIPGPFLPSDPIRRPPYPGLTPFGDDQSDLFLDEKEQCKDCWKNSRLIVFWRWSGRAAAAKLR